MFRYLLCDDKKAFVIQMITFIMLMIIWGRKMTNKERVEFLKEEDDDIDF